ncbi:hypothetical protein TREPR_1819 [Treponema primitia ZAS-2]|uniref:PD-(D/E)XK endonuclease-like domain-containing protein n=1 Tax=Treponema primitia (strain ATCC BAA-887 / DSM 12427 / ZAS-2) TaxID=545694 RepID=F5YLX6_TREPZ|nr:PD-(D/E)XK nuclease family protein [Treponema primitia]AEF86592.1 hypothetical protein TREPR_1819 [Treponema primitia ZAS-2]
MKITFGLNQNNADWSEKQAASGEIHLGPEGMLSFLQTKLGLGGTDCSAVVRIDQYRKRLAAVISAGAGAASGDPWFQKSFELDPWSTAKQLLSWRDELILAGWNRAALPATNSKRLAALSAIESRTEPLAQGFADKLHELMDELEYLDTSCIQSIQLAEPLELLPHLWQLLFNKLGESGVSIKEPPPQGSIDFSDDSLILLESDTEWEAAEALAMWLAADKDANKNVNMIVSDASGVLGTALHRLGLPRTGSRESSKWRAHLQILPLVFANAWQPIELGALVALLTLPISPVPSDVRYWLLRALKDEAGVKGKEWDHALEEIKKQYAEPKDPKYKAKTEKEVDEILKKIDEMLVSDRYPSGGIPEGAIIERCNWIIKSLTPQCKDNDFLNKPIGHAMALKQLVTGRKTIGRIELERMIDLLVTEESLDIKAEASPWNISTHPGGVTASRPVLIWWNFINQPGPAASYWNPAELEALNKAGIYPDENGMAQKREVFAWKNAFLKAEEKVILIRPKKLRGEDTTGHPLWDMITSSAEKKWDEKTVKIFIQNSTDVFFTNEKWELFGRKGTTIGAPQFVLPQGQNEYSISKKLITIPKSTSYSDMSTLIGCPLKWVMEKVVKIRPSDAASIPDINQSIGTLCHSIIQDIYARGTTLQVALSKRSWTPADAQKEAERLFDKKVESMVIELCAEGKKIERARYRQDIGRAVYGLGELLQKEDFTVEEAEAKFSGTLCEVPFNGFVDLLLRDKKNNPLVIDLKWTRSGKYKRQEIKDGLDLQLASYAWLIEEKEPGAEINAGYFIMPENSWLPDNQKNLRQVFQNAAKAWQGELNILAEGLVAKGHDINDENDDESSTAPFKLSAPCGFCQYKGLCEIDERNAQ